MSSTTDAKGLLDRLSEVVGQRQMTLMEVCGTHTMAIAKAGLRALMPAGLRLISGPGCPVCVTPVGFIDHAIALAGLPEVTLASFGDLMRVPGSISSDSAEPPRPGSLAAARAAGGDVRVVYSARDALAIARKEPARQVVFLGVGFETTAPTIAAAVRQAHAEELANFSVLGANKTVPGAMAALVGLSGERDRGLDGFLCPGHVSVIIGPEPYEPLAADLGVACAIAGFEPVEILRGLTSLAEQVVGGAPRVDNCYPAAVRPGGNPTARGLIEEVFIAADTEWRGIGTIPGSGLQLGGDDYERFDAARRFEVTLPPPKTAPGCRCGEVLRGVIDPPDCPLFGRRCTPETPVGACMVSTEGSCAARILDTPPKDPQAARSRQPARQA